MILKYELEKELTRDLASIGCQYLSYNLCQLVDDIENGLLDESTMIYVSDGYEDIELNITKYSEYFTNSELLN